MQQAKLTLVTVVFKDEIGLMKLQARSIARHLNPHTICEIIVLIQGDDSRSYKAMQKLIPEYGACSGKVRIFREAEVASIPKTDGWIAQQILKLKVAAHIKSDQYLILDSKTHMRFPLTQDFLYKDGRIRLDTYTYEGHGLRNRLIKCLNYFEVSEVEADEFASSVPPIVLITRIALQLVQDIEVKTGKKFENEFVGAELTEFFLYFSYIISRHGSLSEFYIVGAEHSSTIFEHKAKLPAVDIEMSRGARSPFMSVHRRAYIKLDSGATARISSEWRDCGLFESLDEGKQFIRAYRRKYLPAFLANYARKRFRKALRL